jgi:hypothetical protein
MTLPCHAVAAHVDPTYDDGMKPATTPHEPEDWEDPDAFEEDPSPVDLAAFERDPSFMRSIWEAYERVQRGDPGVPMEEVSARLRAKYTALARTP